MKKLDLKQLQALELKILISFDNYCKQNGIKYSLGAGTLLGAVRHKGFIPWDDDIDIFMVYDEYRKFLELVQKNPVIDDYKVLMPGDEHYFYPFIKIIDPRTIVYERNIKKQYSIGVWIDIFPIEYISNDINVAHMVARDNMRIARKYMRYFMQYPNRSFANIIKNIYLVFRNHLIHRENKYKNKLLRSGKHNPTKYSGTICWAKTINDIYPSEWFKSYIRISFENCDFLVFKEYDKILSHRYGDYMKIPCREERFYHDPNAYFLEQ